MKPLRTFLVRLALLVASLSVAVSAIEPDAGQISISVGRLLEQGHYTRKKLDDDMSRQLLRNYTEILDYNRLFFTQKDIAQFEAKYATALDDDILLGNPEPAFGIWDLYKKRVESRVAKVKELLKTEFTYDSDRTVQVNRQKVPWPKDEAEADKLWRDRVEGEFLQEKLAEHAIDPPIKVLTRRYDQILRNLNEQTKEDVVKTFLVALAQTYDPHSEYLSKSDLENFQINMKLALVGIGAVLHSDEGYAKIMDLVAGGPAQTDGKLKVGDRITAVAQGDAEFVDTVGTKLDKVVAMIRGKKGTKVRLQAIPANATDPSARKLVELVRDEIKLKEQEAKAEIIEQSAADGRARRVGWITLPSFYADMENSGSKTAKSTTRDVLRLLNRLKQEGIQGLVIDLRRNGGGSLEEAINLTGLFIKKGPVVQARDANGSVNVQRDRDASVAWEGPLVVLTNRLSASASEIFAGALQDYGRAIVVGDTNTFGKGTVQTMLEIGRFIPFLGADSNEAGALKLTIQKFYRVAGGSTQLRGVISDIKLPSGYDHPDLGEASLKRPLAYDTIDPAPGFEKLPGRLPIEELRERSAARVAADPEFRYVEQDLARLKQKLDENKVSLNEKFRRQELADDKARKDKRTAERDARKKTEPKRYSVTLDTADKPDLQLVAHIEEQKKKEREKNKAAATAPAPADTSTAAADPEADDDEADDKNNGTDPVRFEALNILGDFVDLLRTGKTASVAR